jgi:hypothetical protein
LKLWSIQTIDVWATLRRDGRWRATWPLVSEDWPNAYRWMVKQMEARLGQPSAANQMPVWAWYQWNGIRRPKPDLRARGHLPPGTAGIRIELEVPSARVLLSDFDLWHYALNYWYLPGSLAEERAFDANLKARGLCDYQMKPLPDRAAHEIIEHSWERMFDLRWTNRAVTRKRAEKSIQAVLWGLWLDDVIKVTEFTAR